MVRRLTRFSGMVLLLFGCSGVVAGAPVDLAVPATAGAPEGELVKVVAAGLTNPRGFTQGPDGTLVVALGGTVGGTAGVVVIDGGCPRPIVTDIPTGRVAFGAPVGVADVAFLGGRLYALVAGGNIDRGDQPNGLYRIEESGEAVLVANISAFSRDNPVAEKPPDFDTDGQPYAMIPLPTRDGFLVTEGNSNQLLRVGLDGSVARVADFSRGHPIPTGIVAAPGGGVYVALFTHAPYPEGRARVVAVAPDGTIADVWTGLSVVMALAVDDAGVLYALELASGYGDDPGAIRPGTGRVVRQTGLDTAEVVVAGLALPAAMEFAPDGRLDIAAPAFGADGGEGVILRVDLSAGLPVEVPAEVPAAPTCD